MAKHRTFHANDPGRGGQQGWLLVEHLLCAFHRVRSFTQVASCNPHCSTGSNRPFQMTPRKGDFMWLDLIQAELPSLNLEGVCGGGLFTLCYVSSPFEHPSVVLAFTLFVTFSLAQSICLSVHSRNFHKKVWPLLTPQHHTCAGT